MGISAGIATAISLAVTAIASTATAVTSVAMGYYQARQARAQGEAQAKMAQYNAQLARNQQIMAQNKAKEERDMGKYKEDLAMTRAQQVRAKRRRIQATQRAQLAKAGVISTEGTPLLVQSEEAMNTELATMDEMWKGRMERREHDITASQYDYKSELMGHKAQYSLWQGQVAKENAKANAKNYIIGGWVSGSLEMLGGLGSMAKQGWNKKNPTQSTNIVQAPTNDQWAVNTRTGYQKINTSPYQQDSYMYS